MKIKQSEIEIGKALYYEFLGGMSGSFYRTLFTAIAKADRKNLWRLAQGFRGEVYAYLEYTGSLHLFNWNLEEEEK